MNFNQWFWFSFERQKTNCPNQSLDVFFRLSFGALPGPLRGAQGPGIVAGALGGSGRIEGHDFGVALVRPGEGRVQRLRIHDDLIV